MSAPEYVVDAYLNSTWTDISDDVLMRVPVRWRRGLSGSSPNDLTAEPGRMSFALNNSASNSAGLQGYYTPGHPNQRSGWGQDIKVRLCIIVSSETAPWFGPAFGGAFGAGDVVSRYVFHGKIASINPSPGIYGRQQVDVVVEDYFAQMQDFKDLQLSLVENAGFADALDDVLGEMPERPANEWIDTGSETWAFIFDDLEGETNAESVVDDIARSEYGFAYIRGDETDGETFRGENRTYRSTTPIRDTFTASDIKADENALLVPSAPDRVVNDIVVQVTPRAEGGSNEVIVKLQSPVAVDAGASVTRFVDVTDPDQRSAKIGAKSLVTPVGTTDFTANSQEDGGGSDQTADWSITATPLGTRAKLVISNSGGSNGHLRGPGSEDGAQVRGIALRTFSPVRVPDENSDSITVFGRQKASIDMAYNGSEPAAVAVAAQVLESYSGLGNVPVRVRPLTEKPDILRRVLPLDIGDRIAITESMTAVDEVEVLIHGITGEISNKVTRIEWDLAPGLVSAPLIWDDADAGKWDERAWGYG